MKSFFCFPSKKAPSTKSPLSLSISISNFPAKNRKRMRIDEISTPDLLQNHHESQSELHPNLLLSQIESSIKQVENLSPEKPLPDTISDDLRRNLNQLSQLAPFPDSVKLLVWKLSYRLWNACVDLSNAASIRSRSPSSSSSSSTSRSVLAEEHAKLRHVAADLLAVAGGIAGVPSPHVKSASFYHKTGLLWHELRKFELASTCFERATDLVSKLDASAISGAEERKLLLDLSIARSRTAWEVSDRNLAVTLLNRAKGFLFGSPEYHKALAGQYLVFGKSVLSNGETSGLNEGLRLMNEALDLYEKGLCGARTRDDRLELEELKSKTLRFISAAHLQMGEFESVIKCVKVLRDGANEDRHPSLPVLAMKAWLGLQKYAEAEKELRGLVMNKGIPEGVWISALETYFEATGTAGAETAKEVFLGLLGRCHISASAAVRLAHRVVGGNCSSGEGAKVRAKVAAELVSDERVIALFSGEASAKQRAAMHAVLWNCAADLFLSKDYKASAEMFEKSMLYVPNDMENRVLRAKGYRVLCLCHLCLSRLDQALEYINEAEKLEPNITSVFLKFKIYLQKNDQSGAINQIQAMTDCLDFSPDFLSASTHEAIACHALPVAVAALSNLLNYCVTGKSMPATEVVVLRSLVAILSQEPGNGLEVLKYIKWAFNRAAELGPDCFFGKGEIGRREWNWFAVSSWNFGIKSGKQMNFRLCAEFLRLASELYGLPIDGQAEENKIMACKSLILSVTSLIASENQQKVALTDTEVKQTLELLDRAGKLLKSISTGTPLNDDQVNSFETDLFFMYTLCAYDIQGRLNDLGSQLLVVKNFASSKACNPKYLLQIGLNASQGPRHNHEVASFVLNKCLTALLSSPLPEYQSVALIVRKLTAIANIRRGEADDDAVYGMYKQAYRIMVGLKDGEYPVEEGKWLATTAWNRAALPVRLGQIDVAKKWMSVGLGLATHVPGMESYRASMEDFVNGCEKELCVQNTGREKNMPQLAVASNAQ